MVFFAHMLKVSKNSKITYYINHEHFNWQVLLCAEYPQKNSDIEQRHYELDYF